MNYNNTTKQPIEAELPTKKVKEKHKVRAKIPETRGKRPAFTIVAAPAGGSVSQACLFSNLKLQVRREMDGGRFL